MINVVLRHPTKVVTENLFFNIFLEEGRNRVVGISYGRDFSDY